MLAMRSPALFLVLVLCLSYLSSSFVSAQTEADDLFALHCWVDDKYHTPVHPLPHGFVCPEHAPEGIAAVLAEFANLDEVDGPTSAQNEELHEVEEDPVVQPLADLPQNGNDRKRRLDDNAPFVPNKDLRPNPLPLVDPVLLESESPFLLGRAWPGKMIAYCWDNPGRWNKVSIYRGLRLIASSTNIQFRICQCADRGHKVRVKYAAGVASTTVGFQGGAVPVSDWGSRGIPMGTASTDQNMRFDPALFNYISASHEWLHAAGFRHTQSRSDRNSYVKVAGAYLANNNYALRGPPNHADVGPYNFASIMHYPFHPPNFAANVDPKAPAAKGKPANAGQRLAWNADDTTMVNAQYP